MNKEMRKHIDMFNEFFESKKRLQVIVSYDCSNIHKPFGEKLLELLRNEKYSSERVTLSNYLVGKALSLTEIDTLKQEILFLFNDTAILSESRDEKITIVKIITPLNSEFIIDDIIIESEK